jgi:hypothetical protein
MEILSLLIQVVTSWQVIAVTIALILFISIVNYVSRMYRMPKAPKIKPGKRRSKSSLNSEMPEESSGGATVNEQLGLEEA